MRHHSAVVAASGDNHTALAIARMLLANFPSATPATMVAPSHPDATTYYSPSDLRIRAVVAYEGGSGTIASSTTEGDVHAIVVGVSSRRNGIPWGQTLAVRSATKTITSLTAEVLGAGRLGCVDGLHCATCEEAGEQSDDRVNELVVFHGVC